MNKTGIEPVEYKVLIKVDTVEDKSAGGVYLPDNVRDREQMAHDKGVLVATSEMAFSDWKGRKPRIGDRIIFDKYAGSSIQYRNENKIFERYRLCNDKHICAILTEEK